MISKARKDPKVATPTHTCRRSEVWVHFLCAPCSTDSTLNPCQSAEQIIRISRI